LLSAVSANAGTTWVKLDNSADVFAITQQGELFAQVHYFGDLVEGLGVGMAAKTPYISKGVMLTDSFQNGHSSYVCYDFQRPFKTGGYWVAYSTLNGRKVQWLGSGTYTVIPDWLGQ